jgi:predicted RNA-binding protein with RPS1 domain
MVNKAAQEKFDLISQMTGLSILQAKACDEMLEQMQNISFLKQYALGDAQALNTQQWLKALHFKKVYDYLVSLSDPKQVEKLLQTHDQFLAYDSLVKNTVSLPQVMKPFDPESLLEKAQMLLADPHLSFEEVTQNSGDHDPEQLSLAMQYALAIHLLEDTALLHELREKLWKEGRFKLFVIQKNQVHVKALQETWPNPCPLIQKISPELFLKFWQCKKNHAVDVDFIIEDNTHWMKEALQNNLQWHHQGRSSDNWIEDTLQLAINAYLNPKIHRDILSRCYDHAIEQLLPVVEAQWRQLLMQKAIGSQSVLMFYPYGKAGIMIFLSNPEGEILSNFTIYPHAPDYNIEDSIAQIVKVLTRNPVQQIGWVFQTETKKAILKILNTIEKRYPDLKWQLNLISNRLCPLFNTSQKKAPGLEEVKQAAIYLQDPLRFLSQAQAEQVLNPVLRFISKQRLQELWQILLEEALLFKDIKIEDTTKPWSSITDDIGKSDMTHILYEDKDLIEDILKNKPCHLSELFNDYSIIESMSHTPSFIQHWGEDKVFRLQNIIWQFIQFHKPIYLFQNFENKALTAIKAGTRFYGTITKILNYGCFVDLGEGVEGLVHISAIGNCFITDLNLIFQAGDSVIVEWVQYDEKQRRLSLRLHSEALKKKKMPIPKPQSKPMKKQATVKPEKKITTIGPSAMELAFAKLKK